MEAITNFPAGSSAHVLFVKRRGWRVCFQMNDVRRCRSGSPPRRQGKGPVGALQAAAHFVSTI